jgi:hypothetical protein
MSRGSYRKQDILSHVGREQWVDVTKPREPDAVGADSPRLRDRQQRQVEPLQRLGHLRQVAAGRPSLLRLEPLRRLGFIAALVDQELFQFRGHLGQPQPRVLGSPAGTSAGQSREQHLGDALEESFDPPPAAWPTDPGVDQADLQVGGHPFEVPGREVAAVVGMEDPGNAADLPARSALPPDRLPQRQGRLDRRRGGERQGLARHGTAVVGSGRPVGFLGDG